MADNTDEEHLDNPPNIQSENLPDEITPTDNTETINKNQEIENMEVHKHPHHVTHKKKWSEYLLEFLMLFLAVFLGFLAENIREDNVERHREKQYIVSLLHDLEYDTLQFGRAQNRTKYSLPAFEVDSLINLNGSLLPKTLGSLKNNLIESNAGREYLVLF